MKTTVQLDYQGILANILNIGITEPTQVKQVVTDGLERDGIRTSTLGFGDGYDEDLLGELARATGGSFYDAKDLVAARWADLPVAAA